VIEGAVAREEEEEEEEEAEEVDTRS